jgi:stearoyl-CoA desaturase (delta-9 desaturase)
MFSIVTMIIIIFFIAHWYLCLFSQTFFLHRYAAHRSFRLNTFWERFFFLFSYLAQGASYISPKAYAIVHRMHHAYTDTEKDPHSPVHSQNVFAMMWRTRGFILGVLRNNMPVEARFTKNVPDWPVFDLIASHPVSRFAWIGLYTAFYIAFAPSPWFYLLLPVQAAMGAVQGAIVNWHAHKRGYRNFEVSNRSENLMRFDVFFLGEAYHNNHHKFPSRVNMAMKKFEFDPTYQLIRFFNLVGILQLTQEGARKAEALQE